jgi:plasmid maintenance system antidote protein VapI
VIGYFIKINEIIKKNKNICLNYDVIIRISCVHPEAQNMWISFLKTYTQGLVERLNVS